MGDTYILNAAVDFDEAREHEAKGLKARAKSRKSNRRQIH